MPGRGRAYALLTEPVLRRSATSRSAQLLWDKPDPLIDLVSRRQLARADRYALRIPARYVGSVRWGRRAGRIDAGHPVFLVLGGAAALVYQARLRAYGGARNAVVAPGDGWLGLDDDDEWATMLFGRWPVLSDDFARGPPGNDGSVNGTGAQGPSSAAGTIS